MTILDPTLSAVAAEAEPPAPPKATRREWIGLAVLALPCLLYSMDLTVLNLAVPHLSADLKPTSSQLLWIVDIYGFLVAGSLITMGTLGDRIGRRRLLLIGAVAFGIASVAAAFSTSPTTLIAARAVLGVAAATLAPSTLSLLRNMFLDPKERTFAIGIWISSFSAGAAFGPVIGGLVLSQFWWGAVFLINVPVMLLLLLLGPRLLPEFKDPNAGRLDLASAALSIAAVLAVIFGMKRMAEHGIGAEGVLFILAGAALATLFVRRQRRLADPLIDLSLFAKPAFTASLATNIFAFFIAFGSFLFVAQYLQLVLGLDALEAGLWSMPSGLSFIAGSMLVPRLAEKMRPAFLMAGGLALASAGFLLYAYAAASGGLAAAVAGMIVTSLGLAPVFTMTTDLIVSAAPPERAGSAAAMAETSSELGGALGIAVLGSVITIAYRGAMGGTLPEGLKAVEAAAARDTLGAALEIAGSLPVEAGELLTGLARSAFLQGFELVTFISAAIALAVGLVAATALRRLQAG